MAAAVCVKHLKLEFLLLLKAVVDFDLVVELGIEYIPLGLCSGILLPATPKGVVEHHTQGIRFGRSITLEQDSGEKQILYQTCEVTKWKCECKDTIPCRYWEFYFNGWDRGMMRCHTESETHLVIRQCVLYCIMGWNARVRKLGRVEYRRIGGWIVKIRPVWFENNLSWINQFSIVYKEKC